MNLTSFSFLAFLLIFLIIYYVIPKRWQWVALLGSSIFFLFYLEFTWGALLGSLGVLLVSYFGANLIDKLHDAKKRKRVTLLTVLLIIFQLFMLKYLNFFGLLGTELINLFGFNVTWQTLNFTSTIGVSYYTLIMLGYVIDVERGATKPQKNLLKCALFMFYFPQLNSGPLTRYESIKDELYVKHQFNFKNITSGFQRILWGFFKVLVISQRAGLFVDTVYGDVAIYNGFFIPLAAIFFVFQLYTNFSGSIDIIMGASEMLGIKLPENFQTPFFAKTITEFWRRWHISLGLWLKDFIFFPLLKTNLIQKFTKFCKEKFGKKMGKKLPMYLCLLMLWLTIGLWHGGAYTYIVASGMLQFIFIVLEDLCEPLGEKITTKLKINPQSFGYKLFQITRTFLLFSFSMLFFRATSMSDAFEIIKAGFTNLSLSRLFSQEFFTVGLTGFEFIIFILSLVILFAVEWHARTGSIRTKLNKQPLLIRWSLIYLLIFTIIVFGFYGPGYDKTAFIYGQF